ncbi:EVE domain-containing protein [Pseudorhodobacter sp. W20_MBD10_FR17]|uniref:EVE domain-containing protein n=1 Tax=Pseudorhodobacter sp. W20_MBD10_FR17 TaxID=3240266 RepID=UPI003F974485
MQTNWLDDPAPKPKSFWIGVASADHVATGRAQGFMQVCHGKGGPLRRINGGDGVIYYSPAQTMGGKDGLQSFTALGTTEQRPPYQHDMGNGFIPFRRDVNWQPTQIAPIRPLLDHLTLTKGNRNWSYVFRFGLVQITPLDFATIRAAMTNPVSFAAPIDASIPAP